MNFISPHCHLRSDESIQTEPEVPNNGITLGMEMVAQKSQQNSLECICTRTCLGHSAAMSPTSNSTGADTATPTETQRVINFAEMTTVRSAGPDADTAAPDWDGGSGSLVAAPASGDAGYGLTGATGSCS